MRLLGADPRRRCAAGGRAIRLVCLVRACPAWAGQCPLYRRHSVVVVITCAVDLCCHGPSAVVPPTAEALQPLSAAFLHSLPPSPAPQAGDPVTFSCVWCGASTLAIATPDEAVLRLYQADTQDSYKLELPDVVHVPGMVTYLTSVSSDPDGGVIAVGTSTAHVVTWACPAQPAAEVGEDHEAHDPAMGWQLQVRRRGGLLLGGRGVRGGGGGGW